MTLGGLFSGSAWITAVAYARREILPIREALHLPRFPQEAIAELRHEQKLLKAAYQAALVDGIALDPPPPRAPDEVVPTVF